MMMMMPDDPLYLSHCVLTKLAFHPLLFNEPITNIEYTLGLYSSPKEVHIDFVQFSR